MEMTDLLRLKVEDDRIVTPRQNLYFFRISPPNLQILDDAEKDIYCNGFELLQRGTYEFPTFIFCCDLPVPLADNRAYVDTLHDPTSDGRIKAALVDELAASGAGDARTCSIGRAYYIGCGDRNEAGASYRMNKLQGELALAGISAQLAGHAELLRLLRGFLLQEFIDDEIYLGEEDNPDEQGEEESTGATAGAYA